MSEASSGPDGGGAEDLQEHLLPAGEDLELDLPSVHASVRMARHLIQAFAKERIAAEDEIDTLALVATELLSNAVDHGGGNAAMEEADLEGDVRMGLHLKIGAEAWVLSVDDQGGADPSVIQGMLDDSVLPDLEDERGRGMFLLTTMVDEIDAETNPARDGVRITARRKHLRDS